MDELLAAIKDVDIVKYKFNIDGDCWIADCPYCGQGIDRDDPDPTGQGLVCPHLKDSNDHSATFSLS